MCPDVAADIDCRWGGLDIPVLRGCAGVIRVEPFFQPGIGGGALVPGEVEAAKPGIYHLAEGRVQVAAVELADNAFIRIKQRAAGGAGLVARYNPDTDVIVQVWPPSAWI